MKPISEYRGVTPIKDFVNKHNIERARTGLPNIKARTASIEALNKTNSATTERNQGHFHWQQTRAAPVRETRTGNHTEACKRLIKNAIVCWNYLYPTQKVAEEKDPETRKTVLQSIEAGSVVSWGHVNLLGEYDFSDEKLKDSIGIKPPKHLGLTV